MRETRDQRISRLQRRRAKLKTKMGETQTISSVRNAEHKVSIIQQEMSTISYRLGRIIK